MFDAARLGTIALIGVLLAVQVAFVAFFLHLRRQAQRAGDPDQESEWSRYQRRRAGRMLEAP
jgi:hypothetical protein